MMNEYDWIKEWKLWFPKECRDVTLKTDSGATFVVPLLIGNVALFFVTKPPKPIFRYEYISIKDTYCKQIMDCINVTGLKVAWVIQGECAPTEKNYFESIFSVESKHYQDIFRLWRDISPQPNLIIWHTPHPNISREKFWQVSDITEVNSRSKQAIARSYQFETFEQMCSYLMRPSYPPYNKPQKVTADSHQIKFIEDKQNPAHSYYITYKDIECKNRTLHICLDHPLFVRGSIIAKEIYADCSIVTTGQIYAQTMWEDAKGIRHSDKTVGKIQVSGSIYAGKEIVTVDLSASGDIRAKTNISATRLAAGGRLDARGIYAEHISASASEKDTQYKWLPIDALKRKK